MCCAIPRSVDASTAMHVDVLHGELPLENAAGWWWSEGGRMLSQSGKPCISLALASSHRREVARQHVPAK